MMYPKPRKIPGGRRRQTLHGAAVSWATLRAYVFARDKVCIGFKVDPDHVCRDRWGLPHAPGDGAKLTLDHVTRHKGGTLGRRPNDDARYLVAACDGLNVGVPSGLIRDAERSWLDLVEPE